MRRRLRGLGTRGLCGGHTWEGRGGLLRLAHNVVCRLLAHDTLVHGRLLALPNQILRLGRVVLEGALAQLDGLVGVLRSELTDLLRLLADDLGGVVQVGVNELLVGDVDERGEVGDGGEEESKAPGGSDLDEEVRDEGGEEGLGEGQSDCG